jgi:hypothetical protein
LNSDERLERIERTIGTIHADLMDFRSEVRTYVREFRSEVIQRFEQLENRVDLVVDTNRAIDMRLPGLTRAIGELQVRLDKLERPAA